MNSVQPRFATEPYMPRRGVMSSGCCCQLTVQLLVLAHKVLALLCAASPGHAHSKAAKALLQERIAAATASGIL